MSRPVFFVVTKRHGREHAQLYWDELPPNAPIPGLVYVLRLDTLTTGDELTMMPLPRLYALYRRLQQNGKLPPAYEPPKRTREK